MTDSTGFVWLPGIVECEPGFDAAFLPRPVPRGFTWCVAYAGGSSALHPWTDEDIAAVALAGLRVLPAWVPTAATDDPARAAREFVTWLDDHHVPRGAAVTPDMETDTGTADSEWLRRFCDVLAAPPGARGAGALNFPYGSLDTVFGLPGRSGRFVADWTGVPHLVQAEAAPACQYAAGRPADAAGAWVLDADRTAARQRASSTAQIDLDVAAKWAVQLMWRP